MQNSTNSSPVDTIVAENVAQPLSTAPTTNQNVTQLNMEKAIYVIFDLETTRFLRHCHHVIEIAAQILAPDATIIGEALFWSFVRPPTPIPPVITELTGITDAQVEFN